MGDVGKERRWTLNARIAETVLALLCVLSTLAGCAVVTQPGSLPSAEQQCANAGGSWSAVVRCAGTPGNSVGARVLLFIANVDPTALEADFRAMAKRAGLAQDLVDALVAYEKQRLGFA